MSLLLRSSEIIKLPVVTFDGEDIAQVKDIMYAAHGGQVGGFTLNGRGLFAGPWKTPLPWENVVGLGPDAVVRHQGPGRAHPARVPARRDAIQRAGGR